MTGIEFSRPDGKMCPGYLATPAQGSRAPAVLVIQEWWGLDAQIRAMADRFAAQGFRALVPDLFRGVVTSDRSEASHLMSSLDFRDASEQDIQGGLNYLKQSASKTAVVGFCMGGALTIVAAANLTNLDAGVCFYGIPPKEAADPAKIRVPLQCHFAERDDWCTPTAVTALESQLQNGGVPYELHRYPAAHAFMNPTQAYSEEHARIAWERTIQFLQRTLT